MNLEQHINLKKQYELNDVSPYMQNQIQKKKKLSADSISSISGNQNMIFNGLTNIDNISSSQLSFSTTSPSSSAFSVRQSQQASFKNKALPQQPRVTTQQKLQEMTKTKKQQKEDINEISEYQQSLMLFNLLQNLTSDNQQQENSQGDQSNCETPNAKSKSNQQSNNNSNMSTQQSHLNQEDFEAEFLKQLSMNLQQKQANSFLQQYPNQQASTQNSNHFKMPSVPNCFKNSKNEQALNFTSTEEDEDDENYNLQEQQILQVLSQLLPANNQNFTLKPSFY